MLRYINSLRQKIKKAIFYRNVRSQIKKKRKLNVGSGGVEFDNDWFSCDIDLLNLTKKSNWVKLLRNSKVTNIFAEHVWEHLSDEDTRLANLNCFTFLEKNGRLRIAVPDGYHPNKDYIEYVKPNGNGIGSDDHKILYNYNSMSKRLKEVGFRVELLEYWDENGKFHFKDWTNEHGKVIRSKRYDERNVNGELNYTSLIIDAIK